MGNFNYSVVQRLLSEVTSRVYFIFIKMTQNGSPSAAKTLEEICEMDEMKKKTAVTSSVLATANLQRMPREGRIGSLVLALRERFSTWIAPLGINYQPPREKNYGNCFTNSLCMCSWKKSFSGRLSTP